MSYNGLAAQTLIQEGFDPLIVTEGCDGAGKSTLVRHLSKKYDLVIGERGVADRDKLYTVTRQDTYKALSLAVLGTAPRIWDRLFVSEFVYADIVGRPCEFSHYEKDFVVDVMNALEFPMIVCLPPFEVVLANATAAHQMHGVEENLMMIYQRYHTGELPWPEHTIYYDYTEATEHFATLEEVEREVEGYLEERKARSPWEN